MPSLIGGNTELGGSKLKNWKGFLKPNFEPGPNVVDELISGGSPFQEVKPCRSTVPGDHFYGPRVWRCQSQARDSRYTSNVVTLGGRLVRNDLTVSLRAENCLSTLNGLFLAGGTQHMDTHTWMEHREPNCESHELYKGILDDRASGVFSGYIHVYEDAQKTDAYQSSKNLLLSDKAKLESQPQLEIYADDVKCSHGSTIGQLDKEALFYMQSRGIPAPRARTMLIRAFAGDVTDRLTIDAVRDRVDKLITERLPG